MQIDVDSVIQKKSPKLYKWIPKFILNWIKRMVHQEEMNAILTDIKDYEDVAFAENVLKKIGVKSETVGLENIPKTGGCIIAANHPLGGVDGMALLVEVNKIRPDLRFIVNDILLSIPNFKTVFVGVNKLGQSAKSQLIAIEELYKNGVCVVIFPAGFCSRKIDGKIQDVTWNSSFIKKSKKYNLPIIPVTISGKNSNRFYGINLWRRRLGIKFNLELLTLPDEMFKQAGKVLKVEIKPKLDSSIFTNEKNETAWAEELRKLVHKQKNEIKIE